MWNQPCYNTPPNTGGQWVWMPGAAGGPTSPPSSKSVSAKKMLKKMLADRAALDETIKILEESKKKQRKPEDEKKGLHIIHQSMIMMMTAVPIGILDFVLIRAVNHAQ